MPAPITTTRGVRNECGLPQNGVAHAAVCLYEITEPSDNQSLTRARAEADHGSHDADRAGSGQRAWRGLRVPPVRRPGQRPLRYAVFPGGARIRPRLCLAVAQACGEDQPAVTDAAAAAIELLHCASLVHDDLPCFDDAPLRRGKPSVHRAFGERLAVLAGDALIVLAFETLARAAVRRRRGWRRWC